MFELHFVKTGLFDKKWSKFYHELSDSREESDYGAFVTFDSAIVLELAGQTDEFITLINGLIDLN
jgi:uncharacterized protein (UPF0332 family)